MSLQTAEMHTLGCQSWDRFELLALRQVPMYLGVGNSKQVNVESTVR
jgi:hypothetical protein